jgi:AraC-like DNA-binding protein
MNWLPGAMRTMLPMWTGRAVIQSGWAVFHGTAGDQARHRHHAVQVAVGIEAPARLWAEKPGALAAPGIVVPADCLHQLAAGPEPLLLLYVERESVPGRLLDDWCAGRAKTLDMEQAKGTRALLDKIDEQDSGTLNQVVAAVVGTTSPRRAFGDERIAEALARLPRPLPAKITVHSLARGAGLSASRFAHLFRDHTGMALRPYLRWLRLHQALNEIAQGANLTEAAHAAGFADSAHLSRSFRQTFGIAPNVLLHPSLSLQAGA